MNKKVGSEYKNEAEQASFYGVLKTDCTLESARGGWHSGCAHWNCWCQLGLASAAFVSDPSVHQPGQSEPRASLQDCLGLGPQFLSVRAIRSLEQRRTGSPVSGGLVCRISHPAVVLASACFPRVRYCLSCQLQQKFQCAPGSRSRMWMVQGSPAVCSLGTQGIPISVQSSLGKNKHSSLEIRVSGLQLGVGAHPRDRS